MNSVSRTGGRRAIRTSVIAVIVLALATGAAALDFTDTGGSVHEGDINALAAADITRGCNPPANDRYCPDDPITRGQMAAFLVRGLELPSSTDRPFADTAGSVFEADIAALAAADITRGCNPPANDRFCPDERVTRGEMAAFLTRGLGLPEASTHPFADTGGSVFEADIASLAAADITRGCNPPTNDRYCPEDPVTRAQMASFLVRALDLAPAGPSCERWVSPNGSDGADGSRDRPWQTIEHAVEEVPGSGCVITALPGTYEATEIERRFEGMTVIRSSRPYRAVLRGSSMVLSIDGAENVTIQGFDITQTGPEAQNVMVNVEDGDGNEAKRIVLRNNIIHDSYENDLLKIRSGAQHVTVEGNVLYNPGGNEQHMDVNGVRDVVIQDNVFFNDFAASGRSNPGDTKAYVVVKDSSNTPPENPGSRRITLRRNVFMNWQGGDGEPMLQIGNDGKDYHEAVDVQIESNLLLANTDNMSEAPLAVAGARDVTFANNTISGSGPWDGFVMRLEMKGDNPENEGILLANNIYASPSGEVDDFASGNRGTATLQNNLYWVGEGSIASGDHLGLGDDRDRLTGNPQLPGATGVTTPVWNGGSLAGGFNSIREAFVGIVQDYAVPSAASPVVDAANSSYSPTTDILGRSRGSAPDLGAYER